MSPSSYLRISTRVGVVKAILTADGRDGGQNGFLSLAYRKIVNAVGVLQFELNADNSALEFCIDKAIVEVFRSDPDIGLAEYIVFHGIIRDHDFSTDLQGRDTVTIYAYDGKSLLSRRYIAYPPNKVNRTHFTMTPGETIAKTLVTSNVDTAEALKVNGRDVDAETLPLTIETDAASGFVIFELRIDDRPNLLTALSQLAYTFGGDFDVIRTSINTFSFQFYEGQLGTDRSGTVIFSPDRGNMITPRLLFKRSIEKTKIIVGGKGQGALRVISDPVLGYNYTPENDIEHFFAGGDAQTADELYNAGLPTSYDLQMKPQLSFKIMQRPRYYLDQDYFLGDLVTARYRDFEMRTQIYEIITEYREGREITDIKTRDKPNIGG